MRPRARLAIAALAVALLVLVDAQTKTWASGELRARGTQTMAAGHVVLRYRENHGIAFGLMRDSGPERRPLLIAYSAAVALVVGGLLAWRLARHARPGVLVPAGLTGVLGGTIGNLHDRVQRGFVVDFVASSRAAWPTYNLADAFIALGIALCLAGMAAAAVR